MTRNLYIEKLSKIFQESVNIKDNFIFFSALSANDKQQQTNEVFTDKWARYELTHERQQFYDFQKEWYLKLYGFYTEENLRKYLLTCKVVVDAGCGLGYKSEWFAKLSPDTIVIGVDFSNSAQQAAKSYSGIKNLFFMQGDIAHTKFKDSVVDFVSCDQVIMHTEDPAVTFSEFVRINNKISGQIACYFYAKKALPRELLDDHFRVACMHLTRDELWTLSEQLTELGKQLSELNVQIISPEISLLGIKGGKYDLQRFIYWNFLKCFWNPSLGYETSMITNFDWYSPSNARRFSEKEVHQLVSLNNLEEIYFHTEEACYSGRFSYNNS